MNDHALIWSSCKVHFKSISWWRYLGVFEVYGGTSSEIWGRFASRIMKTIFAKMERSLRISERAFKDIINLYFCLKSRRRQWLWRWNVVHKITRHYYKLAGRFKDSLWVTSSEIGQWEPGKARLQIRLNYHFITLPLPCCEYLLSLLRAFLALLVSNITKCENHPSHTDEDAYLLPRGFRI